MKKLFIMSLLFALTFSMVGVPAVAAGTPTTVPTSVVQGGTGGSAPIILAKWETKSAIGFDNGSVAPAYMDDTDRDDSTNPFTQLSPSGLFESRVPFTVCAIVTDGVTNSSGNQDLAGVWVNEVHYPIGYGFHPHSTIADQIDGGPATSVLTPQDVPSTGYDPSDTGCFQDVFGNELELTQLTKEDGLELFCGTRADGSVNSANIKDYHSGNLTHFYTNDEYNEICGVTLPQEQAYVYCGTRSLYYEDPAGEYTIHVKAQNDNTLKDEVTNLMTYLELKSFEVDFDQVGVNYGIVDNLNQWYGPHGDQDMATVDMPTIRNLGNVRLYIDVYQDDMEFGQQSDLSYNVAYRARLGHEEADWWEYTPYETATLEDILDLSEDEKIDFQIMIKQWPNLAGSGEMTLSSQKAEFRTCSK